jgi:hypothetical protein
MNPIDIVLNYLTGNEKGMQQLITWFLSDVMNEEVARQAGVPRYAKDEMISLDTQASDFTAIDRHYLFLGVCFLDISGNKVPDFFCPGLLGFS